MSRGTFDHWLTVEELGNASSPLAASVHDEQTVGRGRRCRAAHSAPSAVSVTVPRATPFSHERPTPTLLATAPVHALAALAGAKYRQRVGVATGLARARWRWCGGGGGACFRSAHRATGVDVSLGERGVGGGVARLGRLVDVAQVEARVLGVLADCFGVDSLTAVDREKELQSFVVFGLLAPVCGTVPVFKRCVGSCCTEVTIFIACCLKYD